jgi:hypothetical protein
MTNWLDQLQTINAEGLDAIDLAELEQPWEGVYSTSTYGESVNMDASVRVAVPLHHCRDVSGIVSMAEAIGTLPSPTESLHLWIGGAHSMGHVIAAVLDIAAPATIETCHVATLTFSKDNAAEWASLIDAGKIGKLTVLCSQYFSKTSAPIYEFATALFQPRGIELFPLRIHCKLCAIRLTDGRTVTGEGSANTRSARTLEQVALFGSPAVYDFHVSQMEKAKTWTKDRGQK